MCGTRAKRSTCIACITGAGIGTRLLAGCTTGAMAVSFAQPTDVVKVRFQAQVRLPESGSVKRYSSTFDAYKTIARNEGVKGLWKGKLKWRDEFIFINVHCKVVRLKEYPKGELGHL